MRRRRRQPLGWSATLLTLGVSGGGGREALLEVSEVTPEVAKAAAETPLGKPYE